MYYQGLNFLVAALSAGLLAVTGLAGTASFASQVLFVSFLLLTIVGVSRLAGSGHSGPRSGGF